MLCCGGKKAEKDAHFKKNDLKLDLKIIRI
jgi:hypothetical protein